MSTRVYVELGRRPDEPAPPPRGPSPAAIIGLVLGLLGIASLFAIRALTPELGLPSLPNTAQDLLTLSISVIIESLPFVILGVVLSIVVQHWIPDRWISRAMPRNPWARRAMVSFLGMFLPVCECGNVPLARGLVLRGFSVSESMTFLLAAPILNPVTIITTHQAFGFDDGILVARLLGGFLIANLIGWVFSKHPAPESLLSSGFAAECAAGEPHGRGGRWNRSVTLFVREMGVIMPALFIGSLIAGLVQVAVPRDVLVTLGSNPLWSILAMMALAFIISVCSNVDAFFILPFASTFMPGSIATFLLFGPIIDIKMLALLRTTFTTAVLVRITVLVALLSAGIGLAVNYVF
ncbi:permease [Salinibacterium sp. SYSU T00001]|uniref:permease n=1 Tax=Homoserinimonas sedimenticola TaxID=2986805 RepID=UPI0022364217|nr:permease [Salinibacterium sedimenticola]MCW4384655.1 permease [Salinibacterium sedimenticola]